MCAREFAGWMLATRRETREPEASSLFMPACGVLLCPLDILGFIYFFLFYTSAEKCYKIEFT